ncbi:MAG TPA: DoxX family membrane protein [Chlamydiales bacterium]|nr:DoxX family membrane protein [Chlamydiales bacterium]
MKLIRLGVLTLSRFFTSAAFIAGAVKNFITWHETERNLISAMSDWQEHFGVSQEMQVFFSIFISWSSALLVLASSCMLMGGLFVLLGVKEKLGIGLLILFLIPATILYHPFWWAEGVTHELQTILFLKNLAILGCLIQLFIQGAAKPVLGFDERPSSMRF